VLGLWNDSLCLHLITVFRKLVPLWTGSILPPVDDDGDNPCVIRRSFVRTMEEWSEGVRTTGEESSEEVKHFAKRTHAICLQLFRSAGEDLDTSRGGSRLAMHENLVGKRG
jgi:hypothetical protein